MSPTRKDPAKVLGEVEASAEAACLRLSPGSKLTKVYSHSSLNLAATDEPSGTEPAQKPHR